MADLTGSLVRWEYEGQWFTARITEDVCSSAGSRWIGEVVDPGNFIGLSEFAPKQVLRVGQRVPNLLSGLLTVIGE